MKQTICFSYFKLSAIKQIVIFVLLKKNQTINTSGSGKANFAKPLSCLLCASFLARRRNIFACSPKTIHKPALKVVSQSEAYLNLPPHLVCLKMAYEVLVYKVTNFYTFFLFLVIGTHT